MSKIRRFYKVFRWVVLVALVAALFMILRTPAAPAVAVSEDATQRVEQKVRRLATPDGRIAGSLRLDEGEVNGWIQSSLKAQSQSGRGSDTGTRQPISNAARNAPTDLSAAEVQSNVRDVKIHLAGDQLTAYVLFNLHGKDLSLTLSGHLSAQDGYVRLSPTQMSLGSMPIPRAALERAIGALFDDPGNREQFRLPPNVRDLRVDKGDLVVTFR
jgi:hypothetical protein